MEQQYKKAFARLHGGRTDYYARWYHDRPMAITSARREELRELHRVLYKCVVFMADHYREYVPRYMPLSEKEMDVLKMQSRFPFRAGTYRPDFLVSENGDLLLCEITSRFFAHGIFMQYFPECIAERFWLKIREKPGNPPPQASYDELLRYMVDITGGKQEITDEKKHDTGGKQEITDEKKYGTGGKQDIFVLKSADKTSEIGLYAPFYMHFGKHVEILEAENVESRIDRWRHGFVISALNQKDLLSFSPETIEAMIEAGMYNDLRTILLIHDKRFMNLWFRDDFTGRCLTPQETDFLRRHTIPTYLYDEGYGNSPWNGREKDGGKDPGCAEGIWEDARLHKDGYILKHYRLGKSERVYAGPLTDEKTWRALWETGDVHDMILQPFIRQRRFPTVWEGTHFEDYICGMMLCVDDRYFDVGMFRASSLPVTNIGDDRKICPVYTDDPRVLQYTDVL